MEPEGSLCGAKRLQPLLLTLAAQYVIFVGLSLFPSFRVRTFIWIVIEVRYFALLMKRTNLLITSVQFIQRTL
jgi:hypothetical protein